MLHCYTLLTFPELHHGVFFQLLIFEEPALPRCDKASFLKFDHSGFITAGQFGVLFHRLFGNRFQFLDDHLTFVDASLAVVIQIDADDAGVLTDLFGSPRRCSIGRALRDTRPGAVGPLPGGSKRLKLLAGVGGTEDSRLLGWRVCLVHIPAREALALQVGTQDVFPRRDLDAVPV